ncbi:hypothetical protein G6F63_014815 [Rhizopus arrhizus]|nr:hypothetical protein G6F63_014815 [Rhizopus arrhizus]
MAPALISAGVLMSLPAVIAPVTSRSPVALIDGHDDLAAADVDAERGGFLVVLDDAAVGVLGTLPQARVSRCGEAVLVQAAQHQRLARVAIGTGKHHLLARLGRAPAAHARPGPSLQPGNPVGEHAVGIDAYARCGFVEFAHDADHQQVANQPRMFGAHGACSGSGW